MRKTRFTSGGILAIGLALLVSGAGCNKAEPEPKKPIPAKPLTTAEDSRKSEPAGAHAHGTGPHDGTLADWGGGKYHVEFTVDHPAKRATVYILGSDEKSAAPIAADAALTLAISDPEIEVELKADPQDGDPEGKSSRFVGEHEKLATVREFSGTISGAVEGTPYAGDFKELPHGDHEAHDDHDASK